MARTSKTAKPATAKKPIKKKAASKAPAAKKPATKNVVTTAADEPAMPAKRSAVANLAKKSSEGSRGDAKSAAKSATKTASQNTTKKAVAPKVKLPAFLTDEKWLKQQHDELVSERATYTLNAESLAAEAAALMADRDPGDVQFDEESGEGDTLAVERDRDLALSAKAREKVDEIDAALERLQKGKYGMCVSGDAGDFIPQERLEALPMAAKCVQHQTAMF